MMTEQQSAIARLLQDEDPQTIDLVKRQLMEGGSSASDLKDLAGKCSREVAAHIQDVVSALEHGEAQNDFLLHCHLMGEQTDLEGTAWMLSRALVPALDTRPLEQRLNQWGRQFLMRIAGAVSDRERVMALAEFVGGELGFRGNSDNYYCERNSQLPCVIETRMGIPITLTLIYRMIGARAAMRVEGVNLPGHFIARHGDVFFDPFHRGRILSKGDCHDILKRQSLTPRPCHFEVATSRQVLLRMLANLLYVYDLKKEAEKKQWVKTWIHALNHER